MKKRMNRILAAVMAGAMVLSMAACGGSGGSDADDKKEEGGTDSGKKILRVLNWGTAEEAQIAQDAIDRFTADHSDVEVKQTSVPVDSWSDFIQKWISMT